MGACVSQCCAARTSFSLSDDITVEANAEVVEELILDLESTPSFLPNVLEVEILKGPTSFEKGFHWKEVRLFRGRRVTMYKTVTRFLRHSVQQEEREGKVKDSDEGHLGIGTNSSPSLSITSSVNLEEISRNLKEAAETVTVDIFPIDRNSSLISWTVVGISAGFFGRLSMAIARPCFLVRLRKHALEEMRCYADEAIRRSKTKREEVQ